MDFVSILTDADGAARSLRSVENDPYLRKELLEAIEDLRLLIADLLTEMDALPGGQAVSSEAHASIQEKLSCCWWSARALSASVLHDEGGDGGEDGDDAVLSCDLARFEDRAIRTKLPMSLAEAGLIDEISELVTLLMRVEGRLLERELNFYGIPFETYAWPDGYPMEEHEVGRLYVEDGCSEEPLVIAEEHVGKFATSAVCAVMGRYSEASREAVLLRRRLIGGFREIGESGLAVCDPVSAKGIRGKARGFRRQAWSVWPHGAESGDAWKRALNERSSPPIAPVEPKVLCGTYCEAALANPDGMVGIALPERLLGNMRCTGDSGYAVAYVCNADGESSGLRGSLEFGLDWAYVCDLPHAWILKSRTLSVKSGVLWVSGEMARSVGIEAGREVVLLEEGRFFDVMDAERWRRVIDEPLDLQALFDAGDEAGRNGD